MRNSNITTDSDKIAFVRSSLTFDSLASQMMQASSFTPKLIDCDYLAFRENFLKTFGILQHHASMQWTFHLADPLTCQSGTSNSLRGQTRASNIANEAIDALHKASWFTNGTMAEVRLCSVLEFLCYIQYLPPIERRIASFIDSKPGDSFIDFSAKIAKKLRETTKASPMPAVSNTAPVAPIRYQPLAPLTCTYCFRKDHLERNCLSRKRFSAETSTSSDAPVSHDSASRHSNVHQTPLPPSSSRSPRASSSPSHTKWCLVHEAGNHPSDECFAIHHLKRHFTASKVDTPSGEASRPGQNSLG